MQRRRLTATAAISRPETGVLGSIWFFQRAFSRTTHPKVASFGAAILRHVEGGLVAKQLPAEYAVWRAKKETAPLVRNRSDSELEVFAICGEDRKWVWVDAKIDSDTVFVWSEKVPTPVAVRYVWAPSQPPISTTAPTCRHRRSAPMTFP